MAYFQFRILAGLKNRTIIEAYKELSLLEQWENPCEGNRYMTPSTSFHFVRHKNQEMISRHLPLGKSILSIGPGTGVFEQFLLQQGWQVFGIDINLEAVHLCRNRGICVEWISFEEFLENRPKHFPDRFDLVMADNTLGPLI